MIFLSVMLDKSVHCLMGNLLAYLSLQLSLLWGIVITKLCWDKTSQHQLLLRMIQLSSIQTKSEISKYKEFG